MYNNKKEKTTKTKVINIVFILFFLFIILKYSAISIIKLIPEKTNLSKYFISKEKLIKENEKLKEENHNLKTKLKIEEIDIDAEKIKEKKFFPIILKKDDSFYDNLIVKNITSLNEDIQKDNPVITKNNVAIGKVKEVKKDYIDIEYFSKPKSESKLLLKNYFLKDEINKKNKTDNDSEKNITNKKIKEEEVGEEENSSNKDSNKENKKEKNNKKDEIEKINILKQDIKLDSFPVDVKGYGNGFFYIEIPREYKISKNSVIYLQGEKLYPVATFFEEKDSEQIPIKKVFFKMLENPVDLDVVMIESNKE